MKNELDLLADFRIDGYRIGKRIAKTISSVLRANGYAILPLNADRHMTIQAEKLGAGEAWAEECWSAMIEGYDRGQGRVVTAKDEAALEAAQGEETGRPAGQSPE